MVKRLEHAANEYDPDALPASFASDLIESKPHFLCDIRGACGDGDILQVRFTPLSESGCLDCHLCPSAVENSTIYRVMTRT